MHDGILRKLICDVGVDEKHQLVVYWDGPAGAPMQVQVLESGGMIVVYSQDEVDRMPDKT